MQASLYFIHLYNFSITSLKHSFYDNTLHNEEKKMYEQIQEYFTEKFL